MSEREETVLALGDQEDLLATSGTFEDLKAELIQVEAAIASAHGVKGRLAILSQVKSGKLVEDDLVAQWNALYSAFMQWCGPPLVADQDSFEKDRDERSFFFALRCVEVRPRAWGCIQTLSGDSSKPTRA
jgi:hypothetical protein